MTADHIIEKIREALEAGPTPGYWIVNGQKSLRGRNGEYIAKANWRNGVADAAYIAACNPQNIAALLAALDAKDAETRCIVADVAKDFRAVNVDSVLSQMGDVVPMLLHRAEAAEAEIDALRKALAPFCKYTTADGLPGGLLRIPDEHPVLFNGTGDDCKIVVTVGDFRRARTLAGDNHE